MCCTVDAISPVDPVDDVEFLEGRNRKLTILMKREQRRDDSEVIEDVDSSNIVNQRVLMNQECHVTESAKLRSNYHGVTQPQQFKHTV